MNGKLDQCPICNENSTNPNEYSSWANLVKDMQKKISDKDKIIELVKNTGKLEKGFVIKQE